MRVGLVPGANARHTRVRTPRRRGHKKHLSMFWVRSSKAWPLAEKMHEGGHTIDRVIHVMSVTKDAPMNVTNAVVTRINRGRRHRFTSRPALCHSFLNQGVLPEEYFLQQDLKKEHPPCLFLQNIRSCA